MSTPNPEPKTPARKVFWREAELSEAEWKLLSAVRRAHRASVFRGNVSSVNLLNTFAASQQFSQALIAALASLGGPHAPLEQTIWFLNLPDPSAEALVAVDERRRVPGWGNSFHKGVKDPLWLKVDALLAKEFPAMAARLASVTAALKDKNIFPNPSAYTAATAILLQLPTPLAPWLFISGRLDGWAEHVLKTFRKEAA